jgi:hypothetical protein
MGNPIKSSEIIDINALNQLNKDLKTVDATSAELLKTFKNILTTSREIAKNTPLDGYKNINEVNKALDQGSKSVKDIQQTEIARAKTQQELLKVEQQKIKLEKEQITLAERKKRAIDKENKSTRDLTIAKNAERQSTDQLAAVNRILTKRRNALSTATEDGRKKIASLNRVIDKNNTTITKNSDKLKQQRINVGNYTNSVSDALNQSGLFSRQIAVLTRIQATFNAILKKNTAGTEANAAAQKGAAAASGGFSKALRVLKIALISTGIGAIVVALGALVGGFASTQRGADAFTKVLRPLQAIFQRLIGFIQDKALAAFDGLVQAFKDPRQAVIDLATAIKDNLIRRFESLSVFGSAIAKLFRGEFADGFTELGDAAVQLTTGIENASEKIKQLQESIRQGELLDDLIKRFEQRQIDVTIPLAQARLEFQKFREIAQDQTKSDEERIIALDEAIKKQRTIFGIENELLNLRIERIELEQSFNDTSREEELELANLKAERLTNEAAAQKKINGLVSLKSGIEKRITTENEKQAKLLEDEAPKRRDEIDDLNEKNKINEQISDAITKSTKEGKELLDQADLEAEKDKENAKNKIKTIEQVDQIAKAASDRAISRIDRELEASQRQQDILTQQALKGDKNAAESLVKAEKDAKLLEARREQTLKKQQFAEKALAFFKIMSAKASAGDETPALSAGKELFLGEALLAGIQGFIEGTGDADNVADAMGNSMKVHNGKDGYLAKFDGNETILSPEQTLATGMTANELTALAIAKNKGELDTVSLNATYNDNKDVIAELRNVKEAIGRIDMPKIKFYYDSIEKSFVQQVETRNKITREHSKTGGLIR